MEESPEIPPYASLMKRAQNIRERMLVEQLSGVAATNKALFLSQCSEYEGKLTDAEFHPGDAVWQKYSDRYTWGESGENWYDWKDMEEWTDWYKH